MFFSGFRAITKAQAAETEVRVARLEAADKVCSYLLFFAILVLSW
jgi:hypothetical protein